MNPKSTWLWLLLAVGLFGLVLAHRRFAPKPETDPRKVLPHLNPATVTSVQVQPTGKPAIHAVRTNGAWRLTEPVSYPAEPGAVDALLKALRNLAVAIRISPDELTNAPNASEEFGFDPPQATLALEQSNVVKRLWLGNKTAPGNQVFAQIGGEDGIYVVDASLLNVVPRDASDWRQKQLVDLNRIMFDDLDVTNAGKTLELQRASTNQPWRIIHPSEARADNDKVEDSLQRLHDLRVREFVSDDPKADMDAFGLLAPDLSFAFKLGTNTSLVLELGKSPTNEPDLAYARLDDQKTVVTVPKALVQPWLALYSHDFRDFFDRHLVVLSTPPEMIEIHSPEENFTLKRQTNGAWRITAPDDMPADAGLMEQFLREIQDMQATRIEKDAVVAWQEYGLASPAREFIFKSAVTNAEGVVTNQQLAQLDFGIKETNIFARRVGENFVYVVAPTNYQRLPARALDFRERRIWNFPANDAVRITAQKGGVALEVLHLATNRWKLAAGSQGIINDLAVEEIARRLGELSAAYWVQRGDTNREPFGFAPDNFQISVELKDRRKLTVNFGGAAPSGFPYAMTELGGTPWVFEFPLDLYQYLDMYLNPSRQTTPSNSLNGAAH